MNDWTAGYVADVGYTYGYYAELNPARANLPFVFSGLVPPATGVHCELGFGQGISTIVHAAASGNTWYGTDFNPAQAAFAQSLAREAGVDAQLFDQSFAEFCTRTDLPDFDSIGLHGIWSWISDENRAVIVDFVRRKLKVGGSLYISYNTQPGWAAMIPMRDLLTEHASNMSAPGLGIIGQIDNALAFAEKLFATNPNYLQANPVVKTRLESLKGQNRNYLAHEYFNRDWLPMPFARMAEWLMPAKLEFACSAHYLDQIDPLNLTNEQTALLREIPDANFRQTVRDFCVNQQFRRDYWVKGARRLSPAQAKGAMRDTRVLLTTHRPNVSLKVQGSRGESTLSETIYAPILDLLADHLPRTMGEIGQAMAPHNITLLQLEQALMVLAGGNKLSLLQDEARIQAAGKGCRTLNAVLMEKARFSGDIGYLASPVTGGGFPVNRFSQLFLLAITQGKQTPDLWADFVWQVLSEQNQRLLLKGTELHAPEDNIAELKRQADVFASEELPILKALGIA